MYKRLPLFRLALIVIMLASLSLSASQPAQSGTLDAGPLFMHVPHNILYRLKNGSNDYFTSLRNSPQFPSSGAIFYIPQTPQPGTQLLKRWISASIGEHMDFFSRPPAYNDDNVALGYPWLNGGPGRAPLKPMYKSSVDHATIYPGETATFQSQNPGYSTENYSLGYGYPRYNQTPEVLAQIPTTPASNGITLSSNKVAGGSIWRLYWPNATAANQYLNNYDYGREIQSALYYRYDGGSLNPTEAGDGCSGPDRTPSRAVAGYHGAPLVSITSDTAPRPDGTWQQQTRSIPMEFPRCGPWATTPLLYPNLLIGKTVTINYGNRKNVVKYTTYLRLPVTINGAALEIPTVFLRANYTRAYGYNAVARNYTYMPLARCPAQDIPGIYPPSGQTIQAGGVILEDPVTQRSMGIFGLSTTSGGPVDRFEINDYRCASTPDGTAETSGDTMRMKATYGYVVPNSYTGRRTIAGNVDNVYNTWIITGGTLGQVGATMTAVCHDLYPSICP